MKHRRLIGVCSNKSYTRTMNYLSHLFFSQRTPESFTGNLMGDFKPSEQLTQNLPHAVLLGIENHRLVDRHTDSYQAVRDLRTQFSKEKRRYAGVITDICFDYFLIKHWSDYTSMPFADFSKQAYQGLSDCKVMMPPRMQSVVGNIIKHRWLEQYATLEGIDHTINMVSKRLRFDNNMAQSRAEIERLYSNIETVFFSLFEYLSEQVELASIEK